MSNFLFILDRLKPEKKYFAMISVPLDADGRIGYNNAFKKEAIYREKKSF